MIGRVEDISIVRDISRNIFPERIVTFIQEVEKRYVMSALTPSVYRIIDSIEKRKPSDNITLINGLVLTHEQVNTLFCGGYYETTGTGTCCCEGDGFYYCDGIVTAIAYLTYSRIVINNPVAVTAFGITQNLNDLSQPHTDKTIFSVSNDAKKQGEECLNTTIQYLKYLGLYPVCQNTYRPKEIFRINNDKL